jgi:hypothetical protein
MAKPDPMLRYLSPLVGATITTIIVEDGTDDVDETHYGFIIEKEGKRYDCMILADEEGNGPGHLDITAKKTKVNADK